ncbi:MAG: YdcF family protein [Acidobacteria bacterium]|nr:YdcF family protein [Acidobacteriota bacterium]
MTHAPSTDALARTLWNYMLLRQTLVESDVIVALGSNDLRVAEHAADLFLRGLAPLLVCSGHLGRLTSGRFHRSEAELFADVAAARGVSRSAILLEARSTNTGDNITFSRALLKQRGVDPQRVILVQKPYMERRALATFRQRWPGTDVLVSSPPIDFDHYPTVELPKALVINILVGDVQRIRVYADRGFQIAQPMPDHVWEAWEELVARGYTTHLVRD